MQDSLREAKVAVARAIRDKKLIEKKYEDNVAQVGYWEDKAMIALQKGREDLARKSLANKKDYEKIADEFSEQLETQDKNVQMLKSSLSVLDRKITDAKRKKDLLVARQKRASAEKKMHDQLSSMGNDNSVFETFDRMEDKVNMMEAEADAAKEISMTESEVLKDELMLLDMDNDVEDDLERMKLQLGMSKEPVALIGDSPTEVDDELEALKKKI
jgi:phage shock protein A